jgi:hypothetical protein
MQGSIGFDAMAGRCAARVRANSHRRWHRVPVRSGPRFDPFDPLFTPVTVAAVSRLILLGLGMALLPILLPFVAGGRLLGRTRPPPVF